MLLPRYLSQVSLANVNTGMIHQVLAALAWRERLTTEDFRTLLPLKWQHVNPYDTFTLNRLKRISRGWTATLPKCGTSVGYGLYGHVYCCAVF